MQPPALMEDQLANLCLSNSEPNLTLQLSLASKANGAIQENGKPMINAQLPADDAAARFVAGARRKPSNWKKRAREIGNDHDDQVAAPPAHDVVVTAVAVRPRAAAALLSPAAVNSVQRNTALRRAMSVIKRGMDRRRASQNWTKVIARPAARKFQCGAGISSVQTRINVVDQGSCKDVEPKLKHDVQRTVNVAASPTSKQIGIPIPISSKAMAVNVAAPSSKQVGTRIPISSTAVALKSALRDHKHEVGGSPLKKAKRVRFVGLLSEEEMKKMPNVTTTGGVPNGKKIEGVLSKYLEGIVSIVCACHGKAFSPEGFVQHAGGACAPLTNATSLIKMIR